MAGHETSPPHGDPDTAIDWKEFPADWGERTILRACAQAVQLPEVTASIENPKELCKDTTIGVDGVSLLVRVSWSGKVGERHITSFFPAVEGRWHGMYTIKETDEMAHKLTLALCDIIEQSDFDDARYTVDVCRGLVDEDEGAALEMASSYMEMHDIDPSPAMEQARRYDRALGYDHYVIEQLEGILERIGKA
ncbi:hypothetical protein PSRA_1711 [Pseudoscardovia radai]|uniref:Uncharacterized protein n=1 Tax=Pseudoscardovia radai TaxID=987066 RepID=A0A261EQS8_9BIFI|nr:hypothetical protein [Pseudoscardovia radai]OZG49026.1 hypothetical protein PSRA_1711 [Pseudoscardovia radai]